MPTRLNAPLVPVIAHQRRSAAARRRHVVANVREITRPAGRDALGTSTW